MPSNILRLLRGGIGGNADLDGLIAKEVADVSTRTWQSSVFEDSLRAHSVYDCPTVVWSDGMTTALSSPVVYKPAIVGTGSTVTNWNGLTSPTDANVLWSPGKFATGNGGSGDLEIHGHDKSGVSGYPWPVIGEFITSATNSVIEMSFYEGSNVGVMLFIEVNGRPISPSTLSNFTTTQAGRKVTITFPFASSRRIRIWGLSRLAEIRVPTGQSITKPTDTIRRRWAGVGDSFANGSGNATTGYPSGAQAYDSHMAMLFRALGVQQPVLAGVGGAGFTTANGYNTRTTDLAGFGLNGVIVYGSVNDPQSGAGAQAACETFLTTLAAVPTRIVVGCVKDGWQAYNLALAAAAAAQGAAYISMSSFIYGPGNAVDPQTGGNTAYFINNDNVHPTQVGHRAIAGYLFDVISRLID